MGGLFPPHSAPGETPARLGGSVSRSAVSFTPSVLVLCWLGRPRPIWGSVESVLGCEEGGPVSRGARGDRHAVGFQYKVLSVLPGSGMGIAVSTPSTQKVSAGRGPGRGGPGRGSERRLARLAAGQRGLGSPLPPSRGRRLRPSAGAGGEGRLRVDLAARGLAAGASSPRQPLVFGAMVHRDEAFETIFSQYMKITAAAASGGDS